jgi:hypothetical protein
MKRRTNFKVFIIELLPRKDLMDGNCDANLLAAYLGLAKVPHTVTAARDENGFDAALDQAIQAWKDPQLYPILHISSHGDTNRRGLVLANKRGLAWNDLGSKLEKFQRVSRGTLMLCMSSCYGFEFARRSRSRFHMPYSVVVGNSGKVTFDDAAIAFAVYYHRLKGGSTVQAAVEAMAIASGDKKFKVFQGNERMTLRRLMFRRPAGGGVGGARSGRAHDSSTPDVLFVFPPIPSGGKTKRTNRKISC